MSALIDQTSGTDQHWLTALLRPVGDLEGSTVERLDRALQALTPDTSMIVVDLDAARLGGPAAVAVLHRAAERLAAADGALLVVNAHPDDQVLINGHIGLVVLPDQATLAPPVG
jgi:hypothetical protein